MTQRFLLLILNCLFLITPAAAQVKDRTEATGKTMVTAATQRSIDRGLKYLADRQRSNGAFGSGSIFRENTGVTSLCGMAFLAAGNTPGRGKYGREVNEAVEFILAQAKQNGYIVSTSKSHGPMYGHGFATLFLAEAYGMMSGRNMQDQRKRLRITLERAVKLIVDSQNKEGGWRYTPETSEADLSVTVCQVMALRAAKNSGIAVPKSTIDAAVKYVKDSQNPDGGFRYQMNRRADSVFPRSAAALVAMYSAGIYKGKELENGLKYVLNHRPRGQLMMHQSHYYYGHYYAVQAMWHAGGGYWKTWYPSIREELIKRQLPNGSWSDSSICSEYGTAMSLLVLQMPNSYLPIFQR